MNIPQLFALMAIENQNQSSQIPKKPIKNQGFFLPYLKHWGETHEEQIEKNKQFRQWLERRLQEEITEEQAQANHEALQQLKATIDSFRPAGQKLFSQEQ